AVLAACQDLRILAAGGDHAAIAAEDPFVHPGLHRVHGVTHVELADAETGANLRAHVAADALADAAEVEGPVLLRDLLRLGVDIVDDVVRTDQHAGAALAAAPQGHPPARPAQPARPRSPFPSGSSRAGGGRGRDAPRGASRSACEAPSSPPCVPS